MTAPHSAISAIIPTRNRAALLELALASVFAQNRPPGEVIVVDDGSTDETPALLAETAKTAPVPLRVIRQDNRGAAAARNAGIAAARGDLLAFLDDDDRWFPRKLEKQAAALERNPGMLIAHTREIWYRRGHRVNQKKKHDPPGGDIFFKSLAMCVVGMSTVMARRELFIRFGGFDEGLPCCEDYDLWLRVAKNAPFLLVPEPLTAKDGGRPDQLSVLHRLGMDKYRIRALAKLVDAGGLSPEQEAAARTELARKCGIYGNGCLKHGREAEGREYLDLGRSYCPSGLEQSPFPAPPYQPSPL